VQTQLGSQEVKRKETVYFKQKVQQSQITISIKKKKRNPKKQTKLGKPGITEKEKKKKNSRTTQRKQRI